MKASELRLGNLIKIGGNTLETYQTYTPTKVTLAIMNEIAGENEERPDAELSVFQPILLTEEWLLKFGFEKEECNWFRKIYNAEIQNTTQEVAVNIESFACSVGDTYESGDFGYAGVPFKHVHQLQNIYYALTGEELQPSRLEKPGA